MVKLLMFVYDFFAFARLWSDVCFEFRLFMCFSRVPALGECTRMYGNVRECTGAAVVAMETDCCFSKLPQFLSTPVQSARLLQRFESTVCVGNSNTTRTFVCCILQLFSYPHVLVC